MSKVIIAIHGLGNKPPKNQLATWGKMAMEEGLRNLGLNIPLPKFELIYWADLIYERPQSINEKEKDSIYYLDESYTKAPKNFTIESHKIRQKIDDFLKKLLYRLFLGKDYKLRYASVSQKFLHKYFHELELYFSDGENFPSRSNNQIKNKIIERIHNTLMQYKNDDIMLIAHSMGSIIAFDALSFYEKDLEIDTFVTMGSPLGAPFVVSKIAEYSENIYHHVKLQTPETVRNHWYNFSDVMDNIALDYKLAEDFKPNSRGLRCNDILVTNTYEMNGIANPHKSFGYLRTKEFSTILARFLQTQ